MEPKELVVLLLTLPDTNARRQTIQQQLSPHDTPQIEALVEELRSDHRQSLRADAQRAVETARLVRDVGVSLHHDAYRALGYRLEANANVICFGHYQDATELYERAEEIFIATDDELELARMQIVRTWAVCFINGYAEAVRRGEIAYRVLEKHGDVRSVALLLNNLAMVHNRFGALHASLELSTKAADGFQRLGEEGQRRLGNNIGNRVYVLGLLGWFNEAIELAQDGLALAERLEQRVVYARIQHNLGLTYYMLGHYNRALHLFDQAQAIRLADGRYHNYVQGELTATFCLQQLRRFSEVIERCQRVRQLCAEHNVTPETPFSLLNEAKAYAGLGQFEAALASLAQTRDWMDAQDDGGLLNAAEADLVKAELLYEQGEWADAQSVALACAQVFQGMERLLEVAQAYLVAAQAAKSTGNLPAAQEFAQASLAISDPRDIAALTYESYAVLGRVAELNGQVEVAFAHYERAIAALNGLQGRVMLEFRPDYMADRHKQGVYEAMVSLCLALDRPGTALEYVEQAKSRALLDMIAHRLDLRVEARTDGDEALVSELNRLNQRHNALYRQMLSEHEATPEMLAQQGEVEGRVTALRNRLLVRNAAYARDLSLAEVQVEPAQPYLAADTLLIEYFPVQDRLLAFCVSAEAPQVEAVPRPGELSEVQRWQQRLQVNLKATPRSSAAHIPHLTRNARAILGRLYENLLAPLAARLAAFRRLIIVPSGSLHYVPFHALFDGARYMTETHQISYLPASRFLRYSHDLHPTGQGMLAVGHSYQDRLPHAVAEAEGLAARWEGALLCEGQATRARVQDAMAGRRVIHLATHGEFHHDNPLFSGLALDDGWLTTLDVFNLRLNASLVTLSGCHTGRNLIGGGDELLGLMRAFLAAGAATLVLSQWAAEDRATAVLMARFYEELAAGAPKAAALQRAQLSLLRDGASAEGASGFQHPFFWAPFYLVGNGHKL
jgi:CHAT domain-containing protein